MPRHVRQDLLHRTAWSAARSAFRRSVVLRASQQFRRELFALVAPALLILSAPANAQKQPKGGGQQPVVKPLLIENDTIPPTVSFAPDGGTYTSTNSVALTIGWCDNGTLTSTTRLLQLNGQNVSTSYTTGTHAGCHAYATSTATLTLNTGSNGVYAAISDVAGNVGSYYTTFTYSPATYTVVVTPTPATASVPSQASVQHTFTVRNAGGATADYTLATTCTAPSITSCSGPSSVHLTPGQTTNVVVNYSSGAGPANGTLTLTATAVQNPSTTGSGAAAIAVGAQPAVANATPPGWTSIDRSQCLTFAIVPDVAAQCGTERITHALPSVTTGGKARTPTLVYYSDAFMRPGVSVDVTPAVGQVPDSVRVTLYRRAPDSSLTQLQTRTYGWGVNGYDASARRIAITQVLGDVGVARFHEDVQFKLNGSWTAFGQTEGEVLNIYRATSSFGAGWWLAGVEQLMFSQGWASAPTDQIVWVGGDASLRKYVRQSGSTTVYIATPSIAGPDTLLKNLNGVGTDTAWVRLVGNNVRVYFDGYGRHTRTVNRIGDVTRFVWKPNSSALRLDSLIVPAGLPYVFNYDASDYLATVSSPGPSTPRVTRFARHWYNGAPSAAVDTIIDPNGTRVSFEYPSWGPTTAIVARTDRRGVRTQLDWESWAGSIGAASTPDGRGHTVVKQIRSVQAIGMDPSVAPTLVAQIYTQFTDPRGKVTKFWLNSYGAPTKIVNAVGDSTTIQYHATFVGLPTTVRQPNGFLSFSRYDAARATLLADSLVDPYGNGQPTRTQYTWDSKWDMVAQTTQPEGEVGASGIDATTGNVLWQEQPANPGGRVNFLYNAAGRLVRVTYPTVNGLTPLDSLTYDALGNVSGTGKWDGAWIWTRVYRDAIGRAYQTTAQLDRSNPSLVLTTTHTYDVADRDSIVVTAGPARSYSYPLLSNLQFNSAAEEVHVRTTYDAEDNTTLVERWSVPDIGSVGIVTTAYGYDNLGRKITQTTGGKTDSTWFDLSGNVDSVHTRRGGRFLMTYDDLGRLLTSTSSAMTRSALSSPPFTFNAVTVPGEQVTFGYDVMGRMVRADNAYAKVRRTYSLGGALLTDTLKIRTVADTTSGGTFERHVYALRYNYDRDGRRKTLHHPLSILPEDAVDSVRYSYNTLGQLQSIQDIFGNSYTYEYDASGRIQRLVRPGTAERFTYDVAERLATRLDSASGAIVHADTMEYDALGRVLQAYTLGEVHGNAYSGVGTLIGFASASRPQGYMYRTERYRSDALGNRVGYYSDVVSGVSPGTDTSTSTYLNDGTGRLNQVVRLGGSGGQSFSYDAGGNTEWTGTNGTGWIEATAHAYRADEKLAESHRGGCQPTINGGCQTEGKFASADEQYRYDALGRRVWTWSDRRAACAQTDCVSYLARTVWDGDQVLYEIHSPLTPTWSTNPDSVIWYQENDTAAYNPVDTSSTFIHYCYDANGNQYQCPPVLLPAPTQYYGRVAYVHGGGIDHPLSLYRVGYYNSSSTSMLVVPGYNWRDEPDGGISQVPISWPGVRTDAFYTDPSRNDTPQNWVGDVIRNQQDGTGLQYKRNRYYDPATGRFTQEDPLGLGGGLNAYGFAAGDPVNHADPFGLSPNDIIVQGQNAQATVEYLRENSETFRDWYDKLDADHSVNLTIRDATPEEMDLGVQNHFDANTSTIIFNSRNMDQNNYDLLKSGETRFIFTAASVMGHEMAHAAGHFGLIDSSCGPSHPASSPCSLRYENLIRRQLPAGAQGGKRLYYDEDNKTRTPAP